jgi:hypothetical protein
MWPLSERKLVFACKKEIVTQQWLDNFAAVFRELNPIDENQETGEVAATPGEGEQNGEHMADLVIANISISQEESRGF